MKKYFYLTGAALLLALGLSACGGDDGGGSGSEISTEIANFEDISDDLTALEGEIDSLIARAEPLHEQGRLEEDKYTAIQALKTRLGEIGSEGNSTNKLKYNELKKLVEELEYDVSAVENPENLDEDTALNSLMDCITEAEPVLSAANTAGRLPDDRMAEFNAYKTEVQAYVDGGNRGEDFLNRLSEIRSDIAVMASQAEADNALMDKLLASPVTVEINGQLEALIDDYLALQDESQEKMNAGEMSEDKFNELLEIALELIQVKEELDSGTITRASLDTVPDIKARLKTFAQEVGSELADRF